MGFDRPPVPDLKQIRPLPQGLLVGIGSQAVVAAGSVAALVPSAHGMVRYGILVVTVFVFAAVTGARSAAIAVGSLGYLVFDGFLINRLGELSWHGSADLVRLVALATAVACGRLVDGRHRLYGRLRSAVRHPSVIAGDRPAQGRA